LIRPVGMPVRRNPGVARTTNVVGHHTVLIGQFLHDPVPHCAVVGITVHTHHDRPRWGTRLRHGKPHAVACEDSSRHYPSFVRLLPQVTVTSDSMTRICREVKKPHHDNHPATDRQPTVTSRVAELATP